MPDEYLRFRPHEVLRGQDWVGEPPPHWPPGGVGPIIRVFLFAMAFAFLIGFAVGLRNEYLRIRASVQPAVSQPIASTVRTAAERNAAATARQPVLMPPRSVAARQSIPKPERHVVAEANVSAPDRSLEQEALRLREEIRQINQRAAESEEVVRAWEEYRRLYEIAASSADRTVNLDAAGAFAQCVSGRARRTADTKEAIQILDDAAGLWNELTTRRRRPGEAPDMTRFLDLAYSHAKRFHERVGARHARDKGFVAEVVRSDGRPAVPGIIAEHLSNVIAAQSPATHVASSPEPGAAGEMEQIDRMFDRFERIAESWGKSLAESREKTR